METRRSALWRDPLRALLTARVGGRGLCCLCAALCAAFFAGALASLAGETGAAAVALTGAACLGLLLWGAHAALGDGSEAMLWLCVALTGALAIAAHLAMLGIKPGRYANTIAPMLEDMYHYDLLTAAAWEDGSWSGGHLLVMALVSRLESFPRMTALKLFDMVCQCLCGCAVLRLSLARGAKAAGAVAGMLACVLAPTMLLNAGCWLHFDATFSMLALWGLFFLLTDRPLAGCALWGLALGTKLQSAFLFPLLLPLFMRGKVSLRHLLALAAAAVAVQAAILLDRQGFAALLARYAGQLASARESIGLGDNAPGVFGLMNVASVREFSGMGLYFGIAAALMIALALLRAKGTPSPDAWLLGAWLLAAALPLLLPQMNARCLYLATLLGFALAKNARRAAALAILEFVSLCGYMKSIFGVEFLPIAFLSLLAIGAAALLFAELTDALAGKEDAHAKAA